MDYSMRLPPTRDVIQIHSSTVAGYRTLSGKIALWPFEQASWFTIPTKEHPGPHAEELGNSSYYELFQEAGVTETLCLKTNIEEEKGHELKKQKFPSWLPIRYFLGKKTDDVIELSCHHSKTN